MLDLERTPAEANVRLVLVREVLQARVDDRRRAVGERAERAERQVRAQVMHDRKVRRLALAVLEPLEDPCRPPAALAARGALAAGLVCVKANHARRAVDDAVRVVHHHDGRRPQHGAGFGQGLVIEAHVEMSGGEHRRGGSARGPGLERAPAEDTAGQVLEHDAERRPQRNLEVAGPLDLATDRDHLRPGGLLGPELAEPIRASHDDVRDVHQRLDVVDHGRRCEEALDGRERRAQPRLTAEALERVEQRRLLAADVRAGPPMQHRVDALAGPLDVGAEVPGRVRLGDRSLQDDALPQVLAADVDVRGLAPDRQGRDRRPLEEPVRIALHELPVVARAGLRLVEVHDHVRRLAGVTRHEAPFHPPGEPGATATAEPARLHDLDDVRVGHRERLRQPLVPAFGDVPVDADHAGVVPIACEPRLEREAHADGTSSRPASAREAARKLPNAGPRAGEGTSPARSPATSSRIRSGPTVSWLQKLIWTAGAKSHTPRHSSSWTVNSPSSDSSAPCTTPVASWAASKTASAPRSLHARLVQTLITWVPVGRSRYIV